MDNFEKLIDEENARIVAERFILDRYPYASVAFEKAESKSSEAQQYYEFAGYSRLARWPESIAVKSCARYRSMLIAPIFSAITDCNAL